MFQTEKMILCMLKVVSFHEFCHINIISTKPSANLKKKNFFKTASIVRWFYGTKQYFTDMTVALLAKSKPK